MGLLSNFGSSLERILFRSGPVFVRDTKAGGDWASLGIITDPRVKYTTVNTARTDTGREITTGADFEISVKMMQTDYATELANIDALLDKLLDVKFFDSRVSIGDYTGNPSAAYAEKGLCFSGVRLTSSGEINFDGGESGIILTLMARLTVPEIRDSVLGDTIYLRVGSDNTSPVQFAWQPLLDGLVPKIGSGGSNREKAFTRASTVTYVDGGGIVRTAKVDEPRYDVATGRPIVEAATTNYQPYSQGKFSTNWSNAFVTTNDNVHTAPDGTLTASIVTPSAAGGAVYQNNANVPQGTKVTASLFIKGGASTLTRFGIYENSPASAWIGRAAISWADGVPAVSTVDAGSLAAMGVETIGNGWYRVWVTMTTGTSGGSHALYLYPDATGGSASCQLWGAQIEANDGPPTSYIPAPIGSLSVRSADVWAGAGTFTRSSSATYVSGGVVKYAGTDEPRYQDDGLLLEPSRENLQLNSNDASAFGWSNGVSVTTDDVAAPDGTQKADTITATGASTYHVFDKYVSTTAACTHSIFAKSVGGSAGLNLQIMDNPTTMAGARFVLTGDGSVSYTEGANYSDSGIESIGDGWYRCWVSMSAHSTIDITRVGIIDSGGLATYSAGSEAIAVWGHQYEVGSYPTSYIPTSGSSVVRSGDNLYFTNSGLPAWSEDFTLLYGLKFPGLTVQAMRDAGGPVDLYFGGTSSPCSYFFPWSSPTIQYQTLTSDGTFSSAILVSPDVAGQDIEIVANHESDNQAAYVTAGGNTYSDSDAVTPSTESWNTEGLIQFNANGGFREARAIVVASGILTPAQIRGLLRS